LFFLGACFVFPVTPAIGAVPTLILHHGKVVTVDKTFSVHQAIAIESNRILQVGPNDQVLKLRGDSTEVIDLNGRMVLPGLMDSHAHPLGAAMTEFGGLDIIINNAGYTWDSTIKKMTDEQFQAMLDVHLVAPFRILRAAAEPIRIFAKKEAEAGREVFRKVVNISSIAGLYGNAGQASYSSAKASLVGLTRTMCKE